MAWYSKQNVWCKKWLRCELCNYQSIWRNAKYNLCCSKRRWFFSQARVSSWTLPQATGGSYSLQVSSAHVIDMSLGNSVKWNLFDYRRVLCYYSKMHFDQIRRTWKPFDLDQTRNINANWIRVTFSIRNHVKNRSYHWCRTSITVSEPFL